MKIHDDFNFLINQQEIIEAAKEIYSKGGVWSLKKLILLSKYIPPFLKILTSKEDGKYKYRGSWFYVDPFSGPGATVIRSNRTDIKVIGSPIISLLKGVFYVKNRNEVIRFTKWYFGDINRNYYIALSKRRDKALEIIGKKYGCSISKEETMILNCDFNQTIQRVRREIDNYENPSLLLFLDPEGFTEIDWQQLERLLNLGYVDLIWVLPTGLFKRGIKEEHIGKHFPTLEEQEKQRILSGKATSNEIISIIVKAIFKSLKRMRLYYSGIKVCNFKDVEMYSIIWASSSKGAAKSISKTISDLKKLQNRDIVRLIEVITRKQMSLSNWSSLV